MRKSTESTPTGDTVKITIVRWGHDNVDVDVPVDTTVGEALEKAGVSIATSESMHVNGTEAEGNDKLDDRDIISIVGNKDGGSEEETPAEEAPAEEAPAEEAPTTERTSYVAFAE
jgi:hypothetical protein|tara:strand:- start:1641 stop:1985 length:345 start_codon:yes stop_codon:yes gene_type:complete